MTMLQSNPGAITVATTDYPEIEFDATPVLQEGETVTAAAVRVQTADMSRQISLPDAPGFTTTSISQLVKGSLLTPGTLYRVIWIMTLSSGSVISAQTALSCPY